MVSIKNKTWSLVFLNGTYHMFVKFTFWEIPVSSFLSARTLCWTSVWNYSLLNFSSKSHNMKIFKDVFCGMYSLWTVLSCEGIKMNIRGRIFVIFVDFDDVNKQSERAFVLFWETEVFDENHPKWDYRQINEF